MNITRILTVFGGVCALASVLVLAFGKPPQTVTQKEQAAAPEKYTAFEVVSGPQSLGVDYPELWVVKHRETGGHYILAYRGYSMAITPLVQNPVSPAK